MSTYINFFAAVTHVVTSVSEDGHCPRTIKCLCGILAGKWIVSFECKCWVSYTSLVCLRPTYSNMCLCSRDWQYINILGIKDSLRQQQWLDEDVYEVEGTVGKACNAVRKARLNILQQVSCPALFHSECRTQI